MNTRLRSFAVSGAALASIGALAVATPTVDVNPDTAAGLGASPVSTAFQLVSKDNYFGKGNSGRDDDDDDDYPGNSDENDENDENDDDGDDHDGFGGGIGSFITNFLDNNQEQVLGVTALIPTIYLGPVAVGNSLLATAYYSGYDGSAAGVEGVLAYVTSQIGVPPADIVAGIVLSVTSMVPQFNIGPVAVGNALLATAYFDGYDGSATGLPGVISYVTSQLGLQAAPAAVTLSAAAVPVGAGQSDDSSVSRVALALPAGAQDDDSNAVAAGVKAVEQSNAVADADADADGSSSPSTVRSSGRGAAAAKAGSVGGQPKARSARSAAARSGGSDS